MDLVLPEIGLIFWTGLAFLIAWFLLGKLAWKPILKSIHEREESINEALKAAEKAKEEMRSLKEKNENMMQQANEERDQLLKEAREVKNTIISEAKETAKNEADKIISSARETIKTEKMAALADLKNQVAVLSIQIAEKIIKEELSSEEKQKQIVNSLLEDVNPN